MSVCGVRRSICPSIYLVDCIHTQPVVDQLALSLSTDGWMDGWMYGRTCIAIRRILRFFLIENMPTNLTSRLELTSPPMRVRCPTYFSRIPRMNVYSFFSRVLIMYKSSAVLNSKEPLAPGLPIYSTCTVNIEMCPYLDMVLQYSRLMY